MKQSIKSKVSLIIFLLVAIALLYFAFRGVDFVAIANGFKNANYFWVVISLLLGILGYVVRTLRWQLLIEPLGHKPSFFNTFGALVTGYVANLIFPRIGEVTRCGTLHKTEKLPFESLIGTVIVERAFDLIMIIILLVSVFFVRIDFFGQFLMDNALTPLWSKLTSLITKAPLIIVGFALLIAAIAFLVRKRTFGEKFSLKIQSLYYGLIDGVKSVFRMKKRRAFFVYTILLWLVYWLMTWSLVFTTSSTSMLGPIDGFFLLVIGSIGMSVPVQGGFGAFHVITAMALGIYGISWEDGLIFAIISHESQTLMVIILGLAFMIYFFFQSRRKLAA